MNDLYLFTVPVFKKTLGGLKTILVKAQAHAKEQSISEEIMLADRLYPDMFPLAKQVQVACDNAKLCAARLSGIEAPKNEDTEQTCAELIARIDSTLAYLSTVSEESYADAANKQITMAYVPGKYLTAFDYVREYAIPNFFFHAVTAYDLIRKNGVVIGKADYVNGIHFRDLPAA